jgi:hypothetical protein
MKKVFNFFFGRIVCLYIGHDKVVDTVMRCKDGHQVVFWRCSRCTVNNYRENNEQVQSNSFRK